MKVFVTGATGFIGTELVKLLIEKGHQPHCFVRNTSKKEKLEGLGVSFCIGDVTDKESIIRGMQGCDWVVHLANIYSFWEPNKNIYTEVNVKGTQNVMETAIENNILKIAHISTVGVYGDRTDEIITEESEVGSTRFSEYSQSKLAGDLIAWDLLEKKGLPLVVIYPTVVVGPNDPKPTGQYLINLLEGKIPAIVFNDVIFTFTDVRDVALGIIKALEKNNNIGEKYIIGKEQITYGDYTSLICNTAGVAVPKMKMSNTMALTMAYIFTGLASLNKKPPRWGMSIDTVRTMTNDVRADGSKAERELDLIYTPIKDSLTEAIKACSQ
ncbi:MAG: NAD-dependent epimerase/dehydratase family protein [Bacillota bacterium]